MSQLPTKISEQHELVSQELNEQIQAVLTTKSEGLQKAFVMATAIQILKDRLTPEIMKPFLALQGSSLGFRHDKEKTGGYPEEDVKACLVDALLLGLQPVGNEFNIIAGQMYPTRQGFGALLEKISGLTYNLTYSMPKFSSDKTSATCTVTIDWEVNSENKSQAVEFPIKSNSYATADAIIGKAERKARRWLFNKIKNLDLADADVTDIQHEVVSTKANLSQVTETKQVARIEKHIANSTTIDELEKCKYAINKNDAELGAKYEDKASEILIELIPTITELPKLLELESKLPSSNFDLAIVFGDKKSELSK